MKTKGSASIYMKKDVLRDIGTSFWLRDAISHLDKLKSRDILDGIRELEWLESYISNLRADMQIEFKESTNE